MVNESTAEVVQASEANEDTALQALTEFADSPLGQKYPSAVAVWENAWDRFIPFLAFPPAVRRVIYTTNAIESLNYQLRRGQETFQLCD